MVGTLDGSVFLRGATFRRGLGFSGAATFEVVLRRGLVASLALLLDFGAFDTFSFSPMFCSAAPRFADVVFVLSRIGAEGPVDWAIEEGLVRRRLPRDGGIPITVAERIYGFDRSPLNFDVSGSLKT